MARFCQIVFLRLYNHLHLPFSENLLCRGYDDVMVPEGPPVLCLLPLTSVNFRENSVNS